ncbi:MAG: hypothetical protein D6811_06170 [Alphaproteobacteria bacterium]|nr:MAG: hypothetical protein D6811_06170 [Alphaproteobacteria bacterium]
MILQELNDIPSAAIPVVELGRQLSMGTGFADEGSQNEFLEALLRAAIAQIEARTGKALIARGFAMELTDWRDPGCQTLPIAPVSAVTALITRDRQGNATQHDPSSVVLVADAMRPQLQARTGALPPIPWQGVGRIEFIAGFGPGWNDVPADLAQAVLMQAAHLYEHRGMADATAAQGLAPGVGALIARWRVVRLIGERP